MYQFQMRPMGAGSILDQSFKIYRANFVNIIMFSLVLGGSVQLIISLLNSGGALLDPGPLLAGIIQGGDPADWLDSLYYNAGSSFLGSFLSLLQFILVTPLVTGGVTFITLAVCHGDDGKSGGSWFSRVTPYYGKLIGTALALFVIMFVIAFAFILVVMLITFAMMGTGAGGGAYTAYIFLITLLMIAMVIVLSMISILYYPVAIHEGRFGFRALGRSWFLLRKKFWKIMGVNILAGLIIMVLQWALGVVWGFLPRVLATVGTVATGALTSPVYLIIAVLLYLDIRMRVEGYDLQVRASSMGQQPAAQGWNGQQQGQQWSQQPQNQPQNWNNTPPPQGNQWQAPPQNQPQGWGAPPPQQNQWSQPPQGQQPGYGQPPQQPPQSWSPPPAQPQGFEPPAANPEPPQSWSPPPAEPQGFEPSAPNPEPAPEGDPWDAPKKPGEEDPWN